MVLWSAQQEARSLAVVWGGGCVVVPARIVLKSNPAFLKLLSKEVRRRLFSPAGLKLLVGVGEMLNVGQRR